VIRVSLVLNTNTSSGAPLRCSAWANRSMNRL
jgi:hypothetical protein